MGWRCLVAEPEEVLTDEDEDEPEEWAERRAADGPGRDGAGRRGGVDESFGWAVRLVSRGGMGMLDMWDEPEEWDERRGELVSVRRAADGPGRGEIGVLGVWDERRGELVSVRRAADGPGRDGAGRRGGVDGSVGWAVRWDRRSEMGVLGVWDERRGELVFVRRATDGPGRGDMGVIDEPDEWDERRGELVSVRRAADGPGRDGAGRRGGVDGSVGWAVRWDRRSEMGVFGVWDERERARRGGVDGARERLARVATLPAA